MIRHSAAVERWAEAATHVLSKEQVLTHPVLLPSQETNPTRVVPQSDGVVALAIGSSWMKANLHLTTKQRQGAMAGLRQTIVLPNAAAMRQRQVLPVVLMVR